MTLKSISKGTVNAAKEVGKTIMADTPKWAKIVRFCGLGLTAVGGALATTTPAAIPLAVIAAIVPYNSLITMSGTFLIMFAQMFKK